MFHLLRKCCLIIAAFFFLVPMGSSGSRREGEDISASPRLISLPEVLKLALRDNFDIQLARADQEINNYFLDKARAAYATLLTLILIPCVYAIVDDLALRLLHRGTVREPDREWTKD